MHNRTYWKWLFLLLGSVLLGYSCVCDFPGDFGPWRCQTDSECNTRSPDKCKSESCMCKDEICQLVLRPCKTDGDCRGGERCQVKKCLPVRCKSDKGCPEPGKPRCDPVLGTCKKRRVGDACHGTDECPGEAICCRVGENLEKQCNFKKCHKDSNCRQSEVSKDACVRPMKCALDSQAFCRLGSCLCVQREVGSMDGRGVEVVSTGGEQKFVDGGVGEGE